MKLSDLIGVVKKGSRNGKKAPLLYDFPLAADVSGELHSVETEISSIHYRAQEVLPGGLFVAIPGFKADGHKFIDIALSRGAAAIVTQKPVQGDNIIIEVENARKALAAISARFYQNPSEKLFMIGITGTNGKTTVTYLIENILSKAGYHVGVIGTVNYRYLGKTFNNPMTTPESLDLQRILSEMHSNGITHVVMEASSHAIDLHRVDYCWFNIGIFTNLTQDHLDYHKNMDSYWACKKRLFTDNLNSGPKKNHTAAVVNTNDPKGRELLQTLPYSCIGTGRDIENAIRIERFIHDLTGMTGTISTPYGVFDFSSPLVGAHNVENILCASGVGAAMNLPIDIIKAGIEATISVPGRLESVVNDRSRFIYVDYAHTPDAMKNVLSALKPIAKERIISVFGCGGDRDRDKRPKMGEIAGSYSDLTIVTSDNPRSESPMEIISQIIPGVIQSCPNRYTTADLTSGFAEKGFVVVPDRKAAIELAVKISRPGDIILIAGKGHETYQIIGDKTIPFDDKAVVCEQLTAIQ